MAKRTTPVFNNLLILGVGLMGGSLALAARQSGAAASVRGWSRREETLLTAKEQGVVDSYALDLSDALNGVDGVVIATPTQLTEQLYRTVLKQVSPDVVVTDVASVKGNIAASLIAEFGSIPPNVVLGHPVCGSEQSGVAAADADLYRNQKVVLIQDESADPALFASVESLWQSVGADLHIMGLEEHDRALALTSHLPHMLSFALMNQLDANDESFDVFKLSGGGFRDFTRIAGSDSTMWLEIALANKTELLDALKNYCEELEELSQRIDNEDSSFLKDYFSRAKHLRETRLKS